MKKGKNAEAIKTSAGKLKGSNRCSMRRGRNIVLEDGSNPFVEKASLQKNAVKAFFLAKKLSREKNFEAKCRAIYRRYILPNVDLETVPEEIRADVKALRKILHLHDFNIVRWKPDEIPGLVRATCNVVTDSKTGQLEIPVLKDYILSGFKRLGDITARTSRLQGRKAYKKVRRYLLSETRIPHIPSDVNILNMFDIVDVEDKPDMVFFEDDGNIIEAVKINCRKPDVSLKGKTKDKSAMQSMELFSKWSSAREYIRDNKAHTVKGSFYFLGRKDDKGDAFEEDFFAPHGGNVVSIAETVSSVEVANLPFTLFFPDQKQEATTELTAHFKPQFEEYAAGEICSGAECEHCDFQDLCNYVPAPLCSQEEKAKKSIRDIVLSKAQEDAVFFRKGIGRINAVAGCGKTLIVALRTAYMLSEGVKPEEILLITFTNAGAAEMKERIEMYDDDLMTDSDLSKLTCTTFNSFGDSIIKKEYARFGFTEEPRLIDDIERKEIITELLDVREIKELNYEYFDMKASGALAIAETAFREIKKNRFSLYDLEEFSSVMEQYLTIETDKKQDVCKSLLILYEHYDQILKERNLIEYQDQESLLFDLLDLDPYYFEEHFGFKHLIVDEFQDTSDNQISLVKKLSDTKHFESLIVVGDDSQTIFEFRDAVTENIVDFFDKIGKTGTDFFITENHRSTPEILNFANTIVKRNEIRVEKELVATRESGKPVEVEGFYSKSDEYDYIADVVQKKLDEGIKPEDIAILAATRSELLAISSRLTEKEIETSIQCPEPMLENSRVKGIISFSRMLMDENASKDILNFKNCQRDGGLLNDCTDEEIMEIIEKGKESIRKFRELSFPAKNRNFDRVITELAGEDSVAKNMVSRLTRLPSVIEKQKYIEEFVRFGGEAVKRDGNFSGVVLTTAHSSKGLEWPVIINSITGYDQKGLSQKAVEGKRRLLFVSSTRARDELYITGQYRLRGKTPEGEYVNNRFLKESYAAVGKEFAPRTAHDDKLIRLEAQKKKKAEEAKTLKAAAGE